MQDTKDCNIYQKFKLKTKKRFILNDYLIDKKLACIPTDGVQGFNG